MKIRIITASRQVNSTTSTRLITENHVVGKVNNPLPVMKINVKQQNQ